MKNFVISKLTNDKTSILVEYDFNQPLIDKKSSFSQHIMSIIMRLRAKPIKISLLLFILFTILYIVYYFYKPDYKPITSEIYSIIIDAGSTGSRIHVFRLKEDDESSLPYKLVNEDLFKSVKPGLSAYADDPQKAADSLRPLLDAALKIVPKNEQKTARITLKATAGLRLISDEKAETILEKVRHTFSEYPFYFTEDYIEILDGKFEGIYSWLTLMYAQDGFNKNKNENDVCTLDLGGGSTQITFVPKDTVTLSISKDNLVNFKLDKLAFNIFTKSFLGYGMMSARMNIFKSDIFSNSNDNSNELSSVCLKSNHESLWKQQNIEYKIKGINKRERNFDDCYSNVKQHVENKLNAPVELRNKKIFAFSFYYDRLTSANLVPTTGGTVKVDDIRNRAQKVCNNVNSNEFDEAKESEFLCMDLTYIYTLLTMGLGIQDQIIHVYKEINKMEISWALGAALHMMND